MTALLDLSGLHGLDPDDREQYSWQLKVAGYTYRNIGLMLGVSHDTVARDVKRVSDKLEAESLKKPDRYRRLFIHRLEVMINSLWPSILNGDVVAIRTALAAMERHAKLTGLDAPVKVDITERVRQMAREQGLDEDEAVRTAEEVVKKHGSGNW